MFEDITQKKSHMSQFLRLDMGPMSYIEPGLYLGNIPNAEVLTGSHWAVLNCTDDPGLDYLNTEPNFTMKRLNHLDGEEYPSEKLMDGIGFIDANRAAGIDTLVCCHAGVSRSAGMIVAYLMYKGRTYNEAVAKVHKSRPFIQIHPKIDLSIRKYFRLAPRSVADLIPSKNASGY